jgi:hypothetical protein
MPAQAFELYSTRKAGSMYFGVVYPEQAKIAESEKKIEAPKRVITVKKRKKKPAEGGC